MPNGCQGIKTKRPGALHSSRPAVFSGAPGRVRTCDLGIRSPLLYPAELRRRNPSYYSQGHPIARPIKSRHHRVFSPESRCAHARLAPLTVSAPLDACVAGETPKPLPLLLAVPERSLQPQSLIDKDSKAGRGFKPAGFACHLNCEQPTIYQLLQIGIGGAGRHVIATFVVRRPQAQSGFVH